ncbi:MAG: hypothetical protein PHQ74_03230 [Crocinitomicaceae bacterium]|nr:hypothetical protein [Crocinitomicaceae bacterium]
MINSKRWIYVVLLSFIGLIIPKELWHDCEEMHQVFNHQDHQSAHFEKDTSCAICFFHFYPAVENEVSVYHFSKTIHPTFELLVDEFNIIAKENISLRGPPKWMIEA